MFYIYRRYLGIQGAYMAGKTHVKIDNLGLNPIGKLLIEHKLTIRLIH